MRPAPGISGLPTGAVPQHRHIEVDPKTLERLNRGVIENSNVFAELMKTVRVCSLGQIAKALFEVGGEYRRSM